MRHRNRIAAVITLLVTGAVGACSHDSAASPTASSATPSGSTGASGGMPAFYAHFSGAVEVSAQGDRVVLRTKDVPQHPSPYFGAGDARYEAPPAGMLVNPFQIVAQDFEFRVPAQPVANSHGTSTNLGPIGVTVEGVVMFNQYAAGYQPLGPQEYQSFDAYNGHPQQQGAYHYHLDPVWITRQDPAGLVGVLLDGFPVYGLRDASGATPSDLDECNGHVGVTPDSATPVYHYHVTRELPYICGCYRGTPGSGNN